MCIMAKVKRRIILVLGLFLLFNVFLVCFYLPSVYPYGYFHYLFGVPVSQPQCGASSEKYYLTITLVVRNQAEYLAEWIEFHLLVGVQHFYIYDNDSTDNLSKVLQPYVKKNIVTLTPFPKQCIVLVDGTEEILTQKLSYKNSIEKHACETRWMALLDSDEFMLPARNQEKGLMNILKRYEEYSSIVLPWLYFTSSGWITKPTHKLVIEAYTRRWKKPKHTWKQILQPKRVKSVYSVHNFAFTSSYHSVNEKMEPFANWPAMLNGHLTRHLYYADSWYTFDVIRLHHYKIKSAEDWKNRLAIGMVSGNDPGQSEAAVKEHWKNFFQLETVESEIDTTMLKYVGVIHQRLRERFRGYPHVD